MLSEHRLRVLGDERFAGGGVGEDVAAFECARTDPCVGDPVAVRGIHPGLDLKTNALNGESTGRRTPSTSRCPLGGGAIRTRVSSSWFTPKLSAAEVNSTGVVSPVRKVS